MIAARSSPLWPTTLGPPAVLLLVIGAGLAAGMLPPLYGAALVGGGAIAIISARQPVIGLAAVALAIPLSPAAGDNSRFPIAPSDALVVVVLAAAVLTGLARRQTTPRWTGAFWPGIAFLLVAVLSAAQSSDLTVSAKEVLRWAEVVATLVLVATCCEKRRDRRIVVAAVLLGLVAEALLGWAQFILRRGPPSFQIGPFLRAYGTFGQPNPFGGYLVSTLPIALAILLWVWLKPADGHVGSGRGRFEVLVALSLLASSVGVIALAMSLSRGALLGFVGAGVVLAVLYTRRGLLLLGLALALAFAVAGLASAGVVPASVTDRLAQVVEYFGWFDASRVVPTSQTWAVVERMAHWQAAWSMYLSNPILGVGPGHYPLAYPTYRVNDFWVDPLGHAHNLYLNVMAELGFLGILTYVVQWVAWVGLVIAAYRRSDARFDRAVAAGVLASMVGVAIHNVFDNLSVHGLETELGLLIGLCAASGWGTAARLEEHG